MMLAERSADLIAGNTPLPPGGRGQDDRGGSIVEVEMVLGEAPLDVVLHENGTAVHTPGEPLPAGNHHLTVRAVDANLLETVIVRPITVLEAEPEPPRGPVDPPRDDQKAAQTPVGAVLALVAVAFAGFAANTLRRRD
jgi:hypothetical protein